MSGGSSTDYASTCLQQSFEVSPGSARTLPTQPLTAMDTGAVAGSVTDRGGDAVAYATVSVRLASASRPTAFTSTAELGRYSIGGLAPGRYQVCVVVDEFTRRRSPHRAVSATAVARTPCRSGQPKSRRQPSSSGRALRSPEPSNGPNSRPVKFAAVYLRRPHYDTHFAGYTDARGRYDIRGLPPGAWRVCLDTTDAVVPKVPTGARSGCIGHHRSFRLVAGARGPASMRTSVPRRADRDDDRRGRAPIANVVIDAMPESHDAVESTELFTNAAGSATLRGLSAGTYFVCATSELPGGPEWGKCRDKIVKHDGRTTRLRVHFGARSALTVAVRDAAGHPIAGAVAAAVTRCSSRYVCHKQPLIEASKRVAVAASGVTNATGDYHFDGLRTGKYAVCVYSYWATVGSDAPSRGYADTCTGETFSVQVTTGTSAAVGLVVRDAGAVAGMVTDSDGKPLHDARVIVSGAAASDYRGGLYAFDTPGQDPKQSELTGRDGSFAIRSVQPGSQHVCVEPAHASGGASTTGYQATCLPATVTVAADATTAGVRIQVEAAGAIEGTVSFTRASHHWGPEVQLYQRGRQLKRQHVHADGTYSFVGLTPGSYVVCVLAQGYRAQCFDHVRWHYEFGPPPKSATRVAVQAGVATTIDVSSDAAGVEQAEDEGWRCSAGRRKRKRLMSRRHSGFASRRRSKMPRGPTQRRRRAGPKPRWPAVTGSSRSNCPSRRCRAGRRTSGRATTTSWRRPSGARTANPTY